MMTQQMITSVHLAIMAVVTLHDQIAASGEVISENQHPRGSSGVVEVCDKARSKARLDALVPLGGESSSTDNENLPIRFELDYPSNKIKSCSFCHSWADPQCVSCDSGRKDFVLKFRGDTTARNYALFCYPTGGCFVDKQLVPVQTIDSSATVLVSQKFNGGSDEGLKELCARANGKNVFTFTAPVPLGGGAPKADKEKFPIKFQMNCGTKKEISSCSFGPITNEGCGVSPTFMYKGKDDKEPGKYRLVCNTRGGCFVDTA